MSYGMYVAAAWIIVFLSIGFRIYADQRRLRQLQREVRHDK